MAAAIHNSTAQGSPAAGQPTWEDSIRTPPPFLNHNSRESSHDVEMQTEPGRVRRVKREEGKLQRGQKRSALQLPARTCWCNETGQGDKHWYLLK